MNNATFEAILEKLFDVAGTAEDDRDYDNVCRNLFSDDVWDHEHLVDIAEAQFGLQKLDGEYGGEGAGEYCYGVIKLDGKFFRAEWSYYSYNGCEFSGVSNTVREVTPTQKTITVYE